MSTAGRSVRPGPRHGFRWTPENIAYAIDLWHRRHLNAPTTRDWERAGIDHPTRHTVQRVYGSWNKAIAAAGLKPRPQGTTRAPVHRPRCTRSGRYLPTAG